MKRESTSRIAMNRLQFWFKMSRQISNVSFNVQLLVVSGLRTGTINLAML